MFGQEKDSIDFIKSIKTTVNDSSSTYYYPRMEEKIKTVPAEVNDTLSFLLYYGRICRKEYRTMSLSISNPERADFDKAVMRQNHKKVIEIGTQILNRNPVDLNVLINVANSVKKSNADDSKYCFDKRCGSLLRAIFSTGDGRSPETAIKVTDPENEYMIKGAIGFFGGKESGYFSKNHFYSVWENKGLKLYIENLVSLDF